jgi:hypothetical protein
MSALAMLLVVAMAVPGNGPEKESGEIEQRLDLSGEWRGTSPTYDYVVVVIVNSGLLDLFGTIMPDTFDWRFVDECNGKCHVIRPRLGTLPGIYESRQDQVFILLRLDPLKARPSSFTDNEDAILLILHRVKPSK